MIDRVIRIQGKGHADLFQIGNAGSPLRLPFGRASAGRSNADKTATIAMTTRSSIKVKAACRFPPASLKTGLPRHVRCSGHSWLI